MGSIKIGDVAVKSMTYNNQTVKIWIHDGVEIFRSNAPTTILSTYTETIPSSYQFTVTSVTNTATTVGSKFTTGNISVTNSDDTRQCGFYAETDWFASGGNSTMTVNLLGWSNGAYQYFKIYGKKSGSSTSEYVGGIERTSSSSGTTKSFDISKYETLQVKIHSEAYAYNNAYIQINQWNMS